MNGAFYVGATGLQSQQNALDAIANNIANMNTPAFKRSDIRFAEVMASRADPAATTHTADDVAGVRMAEMFMLDLQGELARTGNAMDIAIEGRGFIELMGPGGQTLLWRGGTLKVNEDGLLAGAGGLALRAAITVPRDATTIVIGKDGMVHAVTADAPEGTEIGQIALVRIDDADAVDRLDGGLYRPRDGAALVEAAPGEDGAGLLQQGALERSNVEMTDEMVRLMLVQRAYAANAQIMQAADQMMGMANGLRK